MGLVLHPHQSCANSGFRVSAELKTHGRMVEWTMDVQAPTADQWVIDNKFGQDPRKNWELWNFDVAESFLQPRSLESDRTAPYLELQVSPLNQPLALIITKPRVSFYTPMKLNLQHQVELTATRWITRIKVELPAELQTGPLYGGLFSCLGSGPRSFFSLNPNPEERPDFHRPELFVKL